MSSERLRTQVLFQDIIGENDYEKFSKTKKGAIRNFSISKNHVILFQSTLREDAIDFYYKGVISLLEAVISLKKQSFSWATIKLYYSIFYFLRSSLCLNNIGFVRKGKEGFYFINNIGSNFISLDGPDHKAAIELFVRLYRRTDFLQSNMIDDKNPYEWIMDQRENINYKFRTFSEPDVYDIWSSIVNAIGSDSLEFWVEKYMLENVYAFLSDHAILALPLKMLVITHKKFADNDIINPLRQDKIPRIKTLLEDNASLSFFENYI